MNIIKPLKKLKAKLTQKITSLYKFLKEIKFQFIDLVWIGIKVVAGVVLISLFFRTYNFNKTKDEWNLRTIYDTNNEILATDVNQIYAELHEDFDKQANLTILKSYFSPEEVEQLLSKDPIPLENELPKIPGIKQFRSRRRIFQAYVESFAFSDVNRGIKKGLDIITNESDVFTTIDLKTQIMVGKIINEGILELNADSGFGFVVNIDDGAIEAMYTSEAMTREGKVKDFIHPANLLYECGSVLKPLVVFSALFHDAIGINDIFDISKGESLGNRRMKDEEYLAPRLTPAEILKISSNIGAVMIAKKLGHKLLLQSYKDIGLIDKVETDFIKSTKPQIPKNPVPVDIYSMAFGYSLNITPLNLLRAYLVLLNEGKMVTPHLFKQKKCKKISTVFSRHPNIKMICNEAINAMKAPASKYPVFVKFNCISKTGTNYRVVDGSYAENVNVFYICAIPDRNNKYKKLILFGVTNPKPPRLAGLTVRKLVGRLVNQLGPLVY